MTDYATQTWPEMGRTQAVRLALLESGESTLDEIVAFLTKAGREDPKHLVSAALAGLKKAGWAHSVGHGRWAPGAGERDGEAARPGQGSHLAPSRPARRDKDFVEVWECAKGCDHTYESPIPVKTVWHTTCAKARNGDWIPMKKRNP